MKKTIKILALALPFVLAGCTKISAVDENKAALATPAQIKNCDLLGQPEEMAAAYPGLLEAKWDRHQVGCGAIYAYELARQSTFDIELKMEALGAQLVYFDVMSKAYPKLYKEGALGDELNENWRATRKRSIKLISMVEWFDFIIPEVGLLKGAYAVSNVEQDATGVEALKAVPSALKLIEEAVADADVVMLLRIQLERMQGAFFPSLREYFHVFGMTQERVKLAKPEVIIMHPGPVNRDIEIESSIVDGPHSVITKQVTNGVAVRMAILSTMIKN